MYTRVTAVWTGAPGLPGYSRFHFNGDLNSGDAFSATNTLKSAFAFITAYLPTDVTIQVQPTVEHFNTLGELIGVVTTTTPDPVTGGSSAVYAAASGACLTWRTSSFLAGRSVRGRTFLVPLSSEAFQTDGTIASSALATMRGGFLPLLSLDFAMMVVSGSPGGVHVLSEVTDVTITDKAAVLRSRRD
jgi:hypothetical protein